jgi:hypothetical protein
LWHRRRKIIAAGFGKLEELSSHDGRRRYDYRCLLDSCCSIRLGRTPSRASSSSLRVGHLGHSWALLADPLRSRCYPSASPTLGLPPRPQYPQPIYSR